MSNIIRTIKALFGHAKEDAVQGAKKGARLTIGYAVGISLLLLIDLVPAILMTRAGILKGDNWLIFYGGMWNAAFLAILFIYGMLIGIPAEVAHSGFKGAIQRYFRWVIQAPLAKLVFTLLIMFVPLKNIPNLIPAFIICSLIIGIFIARTKNLMPIGFLVGLAMLGIIITAFIPHKISDIGKGVEGWDAKPLEPISKSCRDIKAEGGLYLRNQSNAYYYDIHNGEFKIFNQSGPSPYHKGVNLKPLDESDLNLCVEREEKKSAQKPPEPPFVPTPEPPPAPIPQQPEEKQVPKEGIVGNIPSPAPLEIPKIPTAPSIPKVIPPPLKQAEPVKPKLNPYIQNYAAINRPSSCEAAVLIIDDRSRQILNGDSEEIARSLKAASVNSITNLFSEKFVSDGEFDKILRGDKSEIDNLNLKEKVDYIVLGKRTVITEQETSGRQAATKINAVIEAVIISTETGEIIKISRKKAITQNSTSGVSKENVIKAALEKLAEEVTQEIKKDYKNRIRASFNETSSLFY